MNYNKKMPKMIVQDNHKLHNHNVKILEKDDKVTVGIYMLYFFSLEHD